MSLRIEKIKTINKFKENNISSNIRTKCLLTTLTCILDAISTMATITNEKE